MNYPTVKILSVNIAGATTGYCVAVDGKGKRQVWWWPDVDKSGIPPVIGDVWTVTDSHLFQLVEAAPLP